MDRRRIEIWAAVVIVVFLAGFLPQFLRARSLDRQLAEARQKERLCDVRDLLGAVFLQTTLKNYGVASDGVSRFFNQARAVANDTESPEVRSTLEKLLSRRDEVTAKMARAAPEVYGDVQEMYRTLLEATGGKPAAASAAR